MLTQEQAELRYRNGVQALETKYGSPWRAPSELWRELSEELRAFYIIQKHGTGTNKQILSQYMVPPSVATRILAECGHDGVAPTIQPKAKRANKYAEVYKWLNANAETLVTTKQLVDISGMSYPTVLKFIENNPQYFHRCARGTYKVRNPQQERKSEK